MRVLVTGATGFIGRRLIAHLGGTGHQALTVSRGSAGDFDWSTAGLEKAMAAVDAVVHLAGENIFGKRWSPKQKTVIRESRIETTQQLAELAAEKGIATFLSASAVGYYGPHGDEELDESAPPGSDFLATTCRDWEEATAAAREGGTRVVTLRIGVVLGAGGGALQKMLPPFRLGLGGPSGNGRQIVSWIHVDDVVELLLFLLSRTDLEGPFNATAPSPVTMRELSSALGRALHRPAFFPVPGFLLKWGLGEAAEVLLTGQKALPLRALEAGFEFRFPELDSALRSILS